MYKSSLLKTVFQACFRVSTITTAFLLLISSQDLQARHKVPHYDVTPVITEKEIQEYAEENNDETLIEDNEKKEFVEQQKQKNPPFRKKIVRMLADPEADGRPSFQTPLSAPYEKTNPADLMDFTDTKSSKTKNQKKTKKNDLDEGELVQKSAGKSSKKNIGEDGSGDISLSAKMPAVLVHSETKIEADESFEQLTPTLITMNKLAYAIGKRGTRDGAYDELINDLENNLQQQGWDIRRFEGKTGKGNRKDDIPGFVAYNKATNQMTVILRGSQTRDDDDGSPDWEVNFDAKHMPFAYGGTVHRGFYNRMLSIMPNIERIMLDLIGGMSVAEKETLTITVSGHSQGGGLASIALPLITETLKANEALGKNFSNARDNVVRGYLLSSPRVFSGDDALDFVNESVGQHNIIRQQVVGTFIGDPVPLATPGRTMTALISLIPFVGDSLAERYGGSTGNKSLGYLAADWSEDALRRGYSSVTQQTLNERAALFLEESLIRTKYLINNPMVLFKPETILSQYKDLLNEAKTSLTALLAPLHYGLPDTGVEPGSSLFGTQLFTDNEKTLSELLEQGVEKKRLQRSGVTGAVRTAIENMAAAKASLPTLPQAMANLKTNTVDAAVTGFKNAFSGFKNRLGGLW